MKIITISGAQGCGKSTVINELAERGYNVFNHSYARAMMDLLKTNIDSFKDDENKIISFQDALLQYKITMDGILYDDDVFSDSNDMVFIERSFADLAAFAILWNTGTDEYSEWLSNYQNDCSYWTYVLHSQTFILPSGKFEHINDGVRANSNSQDDVSDIIISLSNEWCYEEPVIIESVNIDERIKEILSKAR